MNGVAGCKGCASSAGASGCPVHSSQGNDVVCGTCGYRGPSTGHGACSNDPIKLMAKLRERLESVESRLLAVEKASKVETPKPAPPVEDGEFGAVVSDVVTAWRRWKAADKQFKIHEHDFSRPDGLITERSSAEKALEQALERLDAVCEGR